MAVFTYEATDDRGSPKSGTAEASGLVEAAHQLSAQGLTVLRLERREGAPPGPPAGEVDEFAFFNRSLAELGAIGMPVERSIREIARGMRRGRFKAALERVAAAMREGRTLEEAVEKEPAFPPEYRWMVRAGAASGNLANVLTAVARHAEGRRRTGRAIAAAAAYPVVVLAMGLAAATAFLIFCVPVYEEVCRRVDVEPPATLVAAAFLGRSFFWPVAGGLVLAAIVFGMVRTVRCTSLGERMFHRVPLLGRLLRDARIVRFLRCLSVLVRAGTPLASALPVAVAASGSPTLRREGEAIRTRLEEGGALGEALRGSAFLPGYVVDHLAAAEQAGRLKEMVEGAADVIEEETMAAAEDLPLVLRPLAIVLTGAMMLGLYVSVVAPYAAFLSRLAP